MPISNVIFLIIFLEIIFFVNILTCYLVGAGLEHFDYNLPYMSDFGRISPEKEINRCFQNVINFGLIALFYVRYLHVKSVISKDAALSSKKHVTNLNGATFYIGFAAAFCFILSTNFEEYWTHYMGSAFGLTGLILYMLVNAFLSHYIFPRIGKKWLTIVRFILVAMAIVFGITNIIVGEVAEIDIAEDEHINRNLSYRDIRMKWKSHYKGYEKHLISTYTEWFAVFLVMFYLAGFAVEMYKIKLLAPKFSGRIKTAR